jgi:hypothetical protein
MSTYIVTYRALKVRVEDGQPSDPILVDGKPTGYQTASGRCTAAGTVRLALRACGGERVYADADACMAAGDDPDDDAVVLWDEVGYRRVAS